VNQTTTQRPPCASWSPAIRLAVLQRLALIKNEAYSAIDKADARLRIAKPDSLEYAQAESAGDTPRSFLREVGQHIRKGDDVRGLWWFSWGADIDFVNCSLEDATGALLAWLAADGPCVVNRGHAEGDLCPRCGLVWELDEGCDDGIPADAPYPNKPREADGMVCGCGYWESALQHNGLGHQIDVRG
jgi:hypothetical protein